LAAKPATLNAIQWGIDNYGDFFGKLHGYYLQHGYAYSEPGILLLYRPCKRDDPAKWVELADADCWWIELAYGLGAMERLVTLVPRRLAWVGFQRGLRGFETPRFYKTHQFLRYVRS
jgi:hypothetical protein